MTMEYNKSTRVHLSLTVEQLTRICDRLTQSKQDRQIDKVIRAARGVAYAEAQYWAATEAGMPKRSIQAE